MLKVLSHSGVRFWFVLGLVSALAQLAESPARALGDDGPLIAIKSPDTASTFVYGSIKEHSLLWDKKEKLLLAHVTFIDSQESTGSSTEDTHEFRLPGVTFDVARGIFFARSPQGESVPVARIKKGFLFATIETLPNATVRIQREKGNVWVELDAVRTSDPGLRTSPAHDPHQESIGDLFR